MTFDKEHAATSPTTLVFVELLANLYCNNIPPGKTAALSDGARCRSRGTRGPTKAQASGVVCLCRRQMNLKICIVQHQYDLLTLPACSHVIRDCGVLDTFLNRTNPVLVIDAIHLTKWTWDRRTQLRMMTLATRQSSSSQ
jgi:hypothetical protein